MELSDKVKIAFASPIVFFSLLFGLAIVYRKYHPKIPPTPHAEWGQITSPRALRRPSKCDDCAQGHHPSSTSLSNTSATAGGSSSSLQPSSSDTGAITQRRPSTVQPHFAEKITTVRRLSQIPGEPDKIQRVNSVASTLNQEADRESDTSPYGGRRSSVGSSLSYSSLRATDTGEVAVGERRLSVLMDPMAGELNVRRVSVGGTEDVVRVRSASQGSMDIRRSMMNLEPIKAEYEEFMRSPPLSPSHPFSAGLQAQPTITFPIPFRLGEPPKSMSISKKTARPDSIAIIKQRVPSAISPRTAGQEPPTCISNVALKSPCEGFSPDSDQGTAKIFEAWRGFPSGDVPAPPSPLDDKNGRAEPLSPTSAIPDPPSIPLPTSPSPLPTFETFSTTQADLEIPSIHVQSDSEASEASGLPAVKVLSQPSSAKISDSALVLRSSLQLAVSNQGEDSRRPSTLLIPLTTPSPGTSPKASPSKITYLADVVRENEERRKRESAEASSIIGISSLENRVR